MVENQKVTAPTPFLAGNSQLPDVMIPAQALLSAFLEIKKRFIQ
jgi:hypothetical protein